MPEITVSHWITKRLIANMCVCVSVCVASFHSRTINRFGRAIFIHLKIVLTFFLWFVSGLQRIQGERLKTASLEVIYKCDYLITLSPPPHCVDCAYNNSA